MGEKQMVTKTKGKRSFEQWKSVERHLDVRPRIPYHHGFDDFVEGFESNADSYESTTDYLEYKKGYETAKAEVACWKCGEGEGGSLGLCSNCLSDYDDERLDREDGWREAE
jgi:hypothetical protein